MFGKFCTWNRVAGLSAALLLAGMPCTKGFAEHDVGITGDTTYLTGMKVFSDYCSRCHGEHADGRGKAVALYVSMRQAHPSNFHMKFYSYRPREYLVNIVRDGGKKHSLSEYMPPFGDELTAQQIDDVVYFIQNVSVYAASATQNGLAQTQKEK